MSELLSKFWSEMLVFFFGIVGAQGYNHWLNKRKNKADAQTVEIENDEKIARKWREYAEKIEQRLNANETAIQTLKQQHEECENNTILLQREINDLKKMMP